MDVTLTLISQHSKLLVHQAVKEGEKGNESKGWGSPLPHIPPRLISLMNGSAVPKSFSIITSTSSICNIKVGI